VPGRAYRLDVAAQRRGRSGQPRDPGVGERQSVQGLADHVAGGVDELLHADHLPPAADIVGHMCSSVRRGRRRESLDRLR
jgi:hypothetical protein